MDSNLPILLITTDDDLETLIRRALHNLSGNFSLVPLATAADLFSRLAEEDSRSIQGDIPPTLLLLDCDFSDPPATELLAQVCEQVPYLLTIALIPDGEDEKGALAVRAGAADYAVKSPQRLCRLPIAIEAAFHRARLETRQARLREIALELSSELDLERVLPRLVALTEELIGAQAGSVALLDKTRDVITYPYHHNLPAALAQVVIPAGAGLAGHVMTTRQPIVLNDYPAHPAAVAKFVEAGVRGVVAAPLIAGQQVIGALGLFDLTSQVHFSDDDAQVVQAVARQAAVAIQNAQLHERTQLRARQMETINELAREAMNIPLPDKWLSHVAEKMQQKLGYDYVSIAMIEGDEAVIYARAPVDQAGQTAEVERLSLGEGIIGWVGSHGEHLLAPDVSAEPRYQVCDARTRTRAELAVPLLVSDQVIGVLDIQSRQLHAFDQQDLFLLQTLARYLAVVIQNARLLDNLRASEAQFRQLMTQSPMPIEVCTPDGTAITVNDAFLRMFGIPLADAVIGHYNVFQDPVVEQLGLLPSIRRVYAGEVVHLPELHIPAGLVAAHYPLAKGDECIQAVTMFPVLSEDGEIQQVVIIWQDVTERVRAQEALHQAEAGYRNLVETATDAIISTEGEKITLWNRAAERMFGYSAEEALGQALTLIMPETYRERHMQSLRHFLETDDAKIIGRTTEVEGQRKDGTQFPIELSLTAQAAESGYRFMAVLRDITARRRAEATLAALNTAALAAQQARTPEEVYAAVGDALRGLGLGLVVVTPDEADEHLVVRYAAFATDQTRALDKALGRAIRSIKFPLADLPAYKTYQRSGQAVFRRNPLMFVKGRAARQAARRALKALGNPAFIDAPLTDESGVTGALLVFGADLSPLDVPAVDLFARQMSAALENTRLYTETRATRDYYNTLLNSLHDEIIVINRNYVITNVNEPLLRKTGYTQEQVVGSHCYEISHRLDSPCWQQADYPCPIVEVWQTGHSSQAIHLHYDAAGKPAYVHIAASPLFDEAGQIIGAIEAYRDVTAEKRLEERLEAIYQLGQELTLLRDEAAIVQRVLQMAIEILQFEVAACGLVDEAADELDYRYVSGTAPVALRLPLSGERGIGVAVVRSGEAVNVPDTAQDARYVPGDWPARSELCVPMKIEERVVGVLNAESVEPNHFTPDDQQLLQTLADQTVVALQNAWLFNQVRQRATQLQTAAEVSKAASSVLEPDQLLPQVVELIRERFDLYYVGLFLVDEADEWAVLWAGTGEAGQIQLEQGHRLQVGGESMVGWCVANARARIALDVGREAVRFDNPFLPDTRSEMALPLISRGEIIGALTVQSTRPAAFSQEDTITLQTMADQLANAIQNARLYQAERARHREAEALRRAALALTSTIALDQVFERILAELQSVVPYDSASVQLLKGDKLEIIGGRGFPNLSELLGVSFSGRDDNPNALVLESRDSVIVNDVRSHYSAFKREPYAAANIRGWMGIPLLIGDQVIGMLSLDKHEPGFYTQIHARAAKAYASQAAVAIENARLHTETEQRAKQLTVLHELDRAITASLRIDDVYHAFACHTARLLPYDRMSIALLEGDEVRIAYVAGEEDARPLVGDILPLKASGVGWVTTQGQPLLRHSIHADIRFAEDQQLVVGGIRSGMIIPLRVKGQVIGTWNIGSRQVGAYSPDALAIAQSMADQLAIAIENARLYEEIHQRVDELATLNRISQAITSTLDPQETLTIITNHAIRLLGVAATSVALRDEASGDLRFAAASGEGSDFVRGKRLAMGQGIVGWSVQHGEPVLVPDVSKDSRFFGDFDQKSGFTTRSILCVPLQIKGQTIGGIEAMNKDSGPFGQEDLRLLTSLAAPAATAIENARLHAETKQRASQLAAIHQVAQAVGGTLDIEAVLTATLETTLAATGVEIGVVHRWDETTETLRLVAQRGLPDWFVAEIAHLPPDEGVSGLALTQRQVLVGDLSSDIPAAARRCFEKTDIQSFASVPLLAKEQGHGILNLGSRRAEAFSNRHLNLLSAIGQQVGLALENARLYEDLRAQVTALQKAQARLVQSEKLAAIGELVAGVAHELNNPLTSILGFAQLLKRSQVNEETGHDLEKIVAEARRAAHIVRGLLDFARQRPPERKPVQINDVLHSTLDLLAYELHTHTIAWTTHFLPNLSLTLADPQQLQQVFVNLIHNARQAMSAAHGGGHLTITTELEPSTFTSHQPGATPFIRVIIQDDGPGILPDILPRIFDPFFTTKPEGEGTGLGLSVCHGIVSEHGGHIWAESAPGQGATFFVELPVVPLEVPSRISELDGAKISVSTGTARILMIDDELNVLEVMARALQRKGYQVDAVSSGEAALVRVAETHYDLIVCDVRMPGLGGLEVYRQVQRQDPDLAQRIIFTTGDIISPATRRLLEETGAPYLSKPFELADLIERIEAVTTGS